MTDKDKADKGPSGREEGPSPAPRSRRALWLEMGAVLALSYLVWLYGALDFETPLDSQGFVKEMVSRIVYDLQVCLPLLLILGRSGEPWSRFGIGRPQWMNDSVIGVIIFLAVRFLPWAILGTLFSGWYSGWIHGLERETQAHPLALPSGYAEHTLLIVAVGLGAFTEELVFRGYLIPRLRQLGTGLIPAVLVSSVLFGSIHLYQGPWWSSLHCVEGLVYGTLFLVAGRLWPMVIAHALFNLNVFDWAAAGAMHLR